MEIRKVFAERVRLSLVGLVALCLGACVKDDEMHWTEQVYLHDRSLVEVNRYAIRHPSGFPDTREGAILIEELRYPPLKVIWRTNGSDEQTMSFDIVNGIPYLITTPPVNKRAFCIGKPAGEYVANYYRWIGGKKQQISKAESPVAIMRWNVTPLGNWTYDHRYGRPYLSYGAVMNSTHQYPRPMLLTELFANNHSLVCD